MSCSEKPFFVIVKKTGQGFNFDNDVTYKSPLATHTLSQATGVMHPSLQVKSDWGLNKRKSISQLITGEAGGAILRSSNNRNIVLSNKKSKYGILYPKGDSGYTMARIGGKGNVNTAPSVAELARLLRDLSLRTDVNVRGSPIEFKRLLDYIQFLMTDKVTNDTSLYLARPNNYHVMEAVHLDGISLEDAYSSVFRDGNRNNSTIYGKAYFLTADRVAALASIVRGIPTVYESGSKNYYNLPVTNAVPTIRNIIASMLIEKGFRIPTNKTPMNSYSNRTQELITPKGRPMITSGPLFAWFLDTRNVADKTNNKGKTRTVGTDFHDKSFSLEERVLVILYWVFNYPHSSGVNTKVIEYFLAILDSFHDFTDSRSTNVFKNIWPKNKSSPYNESRSKTRNGISQNNAPSSQEQHKFLVKLLGVDIYRKVGKFNNSIVNTLSKTNKRTTVPVQLRVAHFLFFITNLLGSQPSRGLIGEFEKISRDIMIQMASDNPINKLSSDPIPGKNLCSLLEKEGACVVIDYHIGSVPTCLKRYSVFHNVGLLDPAEKGVLPWGEVIGEGGCVESARQKAAKKKKEQKQQALLKARKNQTERTAKSKATREQTIKKEEENRLAKARTNEMAKKQASNRREESARKKRERENKANEIVKRQRSGNKPNMNMNRVVNKPNTSMNRVVNKPNTNMNRVVNKPNTNMNRVVKVVPKMENFDLFLHAGNVNNETIKGLLNKIIRNQNSFNTRQKPKIRNVLNKILRRSNQPRNLNSVALKLKARMFPNNRQLRSRVVRN